MSIWLLRNRCTAACYSSGTSGAEMTGISKKVSDRLFASIKRYQLILNSTRARDLGEADTVTIAKRMFADGCAKRADMQLPQRAWVELK